MRCIRSKKEREQIAKRAIELKEKYGLETKAIAERLKISYDGLKVILRWYKKEREK